MPDQDNTKPKAAAGSSAPQAGPIGEFLRWLGSGHSKLRRFYLSHVRPGYVEKMQKLRRGECKRCGRCCSIFIKCPHLKNGNECQIYDRRYKQCGLFPIDERDLRCAKGIECGFRFATDEEEASGSHSSPTDKVSG